MSSSTDSYRLGRGRACLRCRQKKMKCDGRRPACDQCTRAEATEECVYSDGPAFTEAQFLEQHITYLEGRLAELQNSAARPVNLHDPYEPFHRARAEQAAAQLSGRRQNISAATSQALIQSFSRHAADAGFFLHVPRFLQYISAAPPAGARHTTALLNAVYLLGAYLSNESQLQVLQGDFLTTALEHVTPAMANATSQAVLYVLQAEVLLAHYFFANNRTLEGVYHTTAAAAIVFGCRLHLTRSARSLPSSTNVTDRPVYGLVPPVDHIEEGERINGFWTTFVLEKCWSFVLGFPSAFTDDEAKGTQIDVPWPLDITSYERHPIPASVRGLHTVRTFLYDSTFSNAEQSTLALHAKAASLLECATRMAAELASNSGQQSAGRFTHIEERIEQFKRSLPPLERVDPARGDVVRKLLVIHLLGHCATIQLHNGQAGAGGVDNRSMAAANAAVDALRKVNSGIVFIDPFMGSLLATVADVLHRGVKLIRSSSTAGVRRSMEMTLLTSLHDILSILQRWGGLSPFMKQQEAVIREAIRDISL